MFIPLGTDRLPQRRIIVTPTLIGLNLAAFLAMLLLDRWDVSGLARTIEWGSVSRETLNPLRLVTYQFLHDPSGLGHLGFNMLFLWVFGQAVESRLGAIGFAAFYLVGGVFAGLAHIAASSSACIGASGAIAGVSGAFLVLFPRATIRVLLFFFIIGLYHIPAVWFIGLYILLDVINQFSALFGSGQNRVAYGAHLGGYMFGIGVAFILLGTKLLPRTEMDMLYLLKQSRRRRKMKQAFEQAPHIWDTNAGSTTTTTPIANRARRPKPPPSPPVNPEETAARLELTRLLQAGQPDEAINRYRGFRTDDLHVVLPDASQLDLANRLFAAGETELAADAYRDLLDKRKDRPTTAGGSSDEIRLLLASLLIRRLNKPDEAAELLEAINVSRIDDNSKSLRATLLNEIGRNS